jgi:predicted PurR-regulated permease PerM
MMMAMPRGDDQPAARFGSPADRAAQARVFRLSVVGALGVLTVVLVAWSIYAVRQVLILAVIAMFIAVSLDPVVRWLERRRISRPWAVTIVMIVALLLLAAFIAAVVPPIVSQANQLTENVPAYMDMISERSRTLRELGDRFGMTGKISALLESAPERIGNSALGFVRTFFGALASGLLVLVLTIYFMADLPRFRRSFVRLFYRHQQPGVEAASDVVVDKVGQYMIGNLLISLAAGVSSLIILMALQVPYALPLALLVAITDIIPLIGATLGAVVVTLIATASEGIWPAGAVIGLFFLLYQQLENYLIAPRIMRDAVNLSTVAVLLAGLIGVTLLGLVGALMAIPLAAAGKAVMIQIRQNRIDGGPPVEPDDGQNDGDGSPVDGDGPDPADPPPQPLAAS